MAIWRRPLVSHSTPPVALSLPGSVDRQLAVAVDVDKLGVDGHPVAGPHDIVGVVGQAEHQLEEAGRAQLPVGEDLPVGADGLPVGADPDRSPIDSVPIAVRIGRLQPIADSDIVGHRIAVPVQVDGEHASVLPVPVAGMQGGIPEQERGGFDREAGGVGADEMHGDVMSDGYRAQPELEPQLSAFLVADQRGLEQQRPPHPVDLGPRRGGANAGALRESQGGPDPRPFFHVVLSRDGVAEDESVGAAAGDVDRANRPVAAGVRFDAHAEVGQLRVGLVADGDQRAEDRLVVVLVAHGVSERGQAGESAPVDGLERHEVGRESEYCVVGGGAGRVFN